jgi:hypothetical protein
LVLDGEVLSVKNYLNSETIYFFSYLVLPVYMAVNLQDFNITLGWQTGWMIRSAFPSEKSELVDEIWLESSTVQLNSVFMIR